LNLIFGKITSKENNVTQGLEKLCLGLWEMDVTSSYSTNTTRGSGGLALKHAIDIHITYNQVVFPSKP
jgi:hypothetical protein